MKAGALFLILMLVGILAARTELRAEVQDPEPLNCAEWTSAATTFESAGVKLGARVAAIPLDLRQRNAPLARYADGLEVRSYLGYDAINRPVASLETIKCVGGGEVVVGIDVGGAVFGPFPELSEWARKEESELTKAGIKNINRDSRGRELFLWGVKAHTDPDNGLIDYVLLRRECVPSQDGERSVCGLASWRVHYVRSRKEIR